MRIETFIIPKEHPTTKKVVEVMIIQPLEHIEEDGHWPLVEVIYKALGKGTKYFVIDMQNTVRFHGSSIYSMVAVCEVVYSKAGSLVFARLSSSNKERITKGLSDILKAFDDYHTAVEGSLGSSPNMPDLFKKSS